MTTTHNLQDFAAKYWLSSAHNAYGCKVEGVAYEILQRGRGYR